MRGKKGDCAGNCAGLQNLVMNQIFNLQCSSQTRQGGNSV